jgi:putative nucleotidyltransferase with HDIG domain
MSTGNKKKRRIERVTALELPPGLWGVLRSELRRGHVLVRLALCVLAGIILWAVTRGWSPPMPHHLGDVPARDITVRTQFQQVDEQATAEAREQARHLAVAVYDQDATELLQLQAKLENEVSQVVAAEKLADVQALWNEFRLPLAPGTPEPTAEERQQRFQRFRESLTGEGALESFNTALAEAMAPLQQHGLLDKLPSEHDANQERIAVRPVGSEGFEANYPISDVLVENAAGQLQKSLEQKMPSLEVASRVFAYLRPRLPVTLKLNVVATRKEQDKAAADVNPKMKVYPAGTVLAHAGQPLGKNSLELLRLEHQQMLVERPLSAEVARSLAVFGMYVGLFIVCGAYIHVRQPRILADLGRLATLLALVVLTVALMLVTSHDEWRAELVPLMLFGMTMAIAYRQELAMLLTASVTLIGVEALGPSLADAVALMATATVGILLLARVRTRSKLLTVGFVSGGVAMLTILGVGTLEGEPYGHLLTASLLWALWAVIAGSLMTCLLPVVERVFSVQTDLSLIELGDPAHPLLQELIRRAPGTYNHSITVASLAEAAAESIGARGLLVRVGAYFHDIGKMLKPGYFVENQGQGDNRHRSLVPAMSTLVIIAHVKDGVDLARQNKVPEPVVDFIQQHHGTTLVEYFYHQASESRKADPNGSDIDESSFRYPGPKPQTKEAGILMLADAVESASRALVEPTPSRIESLVEELSRKRLLDGQFDECGLTLEEVHKVGDSLVKSLTAVYHGRVKYPDQETA